MGQTIKGGNETNTIDWSEIFDVFASEYGYTWDTFISMTFKQVNALMVAFNKRKHNEMALQAAMHGVKMEPIREKIPMTKKDKKTLNDLIQKKLAEKRNGK